MTRTSSSVICALFSALLLLPAAAQRLTPQPNLLPLSSAENAVLERLASLQTLPDGPWRFHAGDVPHGESPTLDDSKWTVVNGRTKAGKEAVWYRRSIEVPKTLN